MLTSKFDVPFAPTAASIWRAVPCVVPNGRIASRLVAVMSTELLQETDRTPRMFASAKSHSIGIACRPKRFLTLWPAAL